MLFGLYLGHFRSGEVFFFRELFTSQRAETLWYFLRRDAKERKWLLNHFNLLSAEPANLSPSGFETKESLSSDQQGQQVDAPSAPKLRRR